MSYYDSLIRRSERQRKQAQRKALFECRDLDADLFEHDECEVFAIRESIERYENAH